MLGVDLFFSNRLRAWGERLGRLSWGLVWRYGLGWNFPGLSFDPMFQDGRILCLETYFVHSIFHY